MNLLKFFKTKEEKQNSLDNKQEIKNLDLLNHNEEIWFDIDKVKPPNKVVLGAVYSYDCGWAIDSVWWNTERNKWFLSGTVYPTEAHLNYEYWRKMVDNPKIYVPY